MRKCCVCQMRDARALIDVDLPMGSVTLCGSHDLMRRRSSIPAHSVAELKMLFGERRETNRRGRPEVDELAAALSAAFSNDQRSADRRA